ncbi:Rho GTPase activation protein [Backusella circina FSU 941]|nr:Rho GTPase activation protein [Backusella circina FSU 941]
MMEQKRKKRNLFTLLFKNGKNSKGGSNDVNLFGVPLSDASNTGSILWGLQVPDPVYLCFQEICRKGLTTEGLFRLSGTASEVIMLENQLNSYTPDERKRIDITQCDIHALTSLVKKYLRCLPDPVIPTSFHDQFLETDVDDIASFGNIMMKLPFYNRQLLHAILLMSSKIQDHVHLNMMSPEALATVFAPICTGFEQRIQTFDFTPTKQDIHAQIATNRQWTRIWKELIEERALFIDMLHRQHYLENAWSRSLPSSPFSVTGTTPLPEEIFMAQFTPVIEVAKPNQDRLKKTSNSASTIRRIFTISTLRL